MMMTITTQMDAQAQAESHLAIYQLSFFVIVFVIVIVFTKEVWHEYSTFA